MQFSSIRKHILVHTRTNTYECLEKAPARYLFSEVVLVDSYSSGPVQFMVYITDDVVVGAREDVMFPLFVDLATDIDDDILARINNVCVRYVKPRKATTFIFIIFNTAGDSLLAYKDQVLPRVKSSERIENFFNGIGFYDMRLTAAHTMHDPVADEETVVYTGRVSSFANVILDNNYNWRNTQNKLTKRLDAFLLYSIKLNEAYTSQRFSLVITEPGGMVITYDGSLPVTNSILDELDNILQSVKPRYEMACLTKDCWLISCAKKYTTTSSRYTWIALSSINNPEVVKLLHERSGGVG